MYVCIARISDRVCVVLFNFFKEFLKLLSSEILQKKNFESEIKVKLFFKVFNRADTHYTARAIYAPFRRLADRSGPVASLLVAVAIGGTCRVCLTLKKIFLENI